MERIPNWFTLNFFNIIISLLAFLGSSSIIIYIILGSYFSKYHVPIYDLKELTVYAPLILFYAALFCLIIVGFFTIPVIIRISFPIKAINTLAVFRLNPYAKRKGLSVWSVSKLYGQYALPLSFPGSLIVSCTHTWLIYKVLTDHSPSTVEVYLLAVSILFYVFLTILIFCVTFMYRQRIKLRFKRARGLMTHDVAEKHIDFCKGFIGLSMVGSVICLPVYMILLDLSIKNEQLMLLVLAPTFVILYYLFALVVSGFYCLDYLPSETDDQTRPHFTKNLREQMKAKKVLWIAPLFGIAFYFIVYPGLQKNTELVLWYLGIGGGLPVTVYIDSEKQDMFHRNMLENTIKDDKHAYLYPLRPLRLILRGESKVYVYDDGSDGCRVTDGAETSQPGTTFLYLPL